MFVLKTQHFNNRASSNTLVEQVKRRWSSDLIEGSNIYTLDLQRKKSPISQGVYLFEHIYGVIQGFMCINFYFKLICTTKPFYINNNKAFN